MKARIIAIILIMAQCTYLLPAQELPGDLGRGRARLEQYLDRAALERSAESWEAIAAAGLEAAMLEWEGGHLYLKEADPQGWAALRGAAAAAYGLEKEKAYVEWAGRRIYAEAAWLEASGLGAELRRAAGEWTYTRGDGTGTREIDIREAGSAREAWDLVAGEIIDRYLAGWEERQLGAYSELWGRFGGNGTGESEREAIYRELGEEYRENAKAEYLRIARAEGNDLMRALLYDGASLKKKKGEEAAGAIARQLAEEAKAATDNEIARLFGELDTKISAAGQEEAAAESGEWLESFRRAFERGLAEWDAAGEAFLTARAEWERDAEQAYLESEGAWLQAYLRLEEARGAWERELLEKLEAGTKEWEKREVSLAAELEVARREFAAALEERTENRRKMIDAQTGIYERSRELLEMARQGAELWYEDWGALYGRVEEKYVALFGSQGPPELAGYAPGHIAGALSKPDFNSLTGGGGEKLAELIRQLELWKGVYLETIRKIYEDEAASYIPEIERLVEQLKEEIGILEDELEGLDLDDDLYDDKVEAINVQIAEKESEIIGNDETIAALRSGYGRLEGLLESKPVEEISAGEVLDALGALQSHFSGQESESARIAAGFSAEKWESARGLTDEKNGWLVLAGKYRKEADNAVVEMYRSCGIDISRGTMEGYGDELAGELLKARAVLQYWLEEKEVAEAVEEYARRNDSSLEGARETQAALEVAKGGYQAALAEYEGALAALAAAAEGIGGADARYREAEAALEGLRVGVQRAREEYMAVVAVIQGVEYDYVNEAIAKIAADMQKNRAGQAGAHEAYVKALRAFAAAQYARMLAEEAGRVGAGDSCWESAEVLGEKLAAIEKAKTGGADGILETAAARKDILAAALSYESGLLEALGLAYLEAEAGERAGLEGAIRATWEAVELHYKQERAGAERAARYLQGAATLDEKDEAWRRETELRSWLTGQLAGIEEELKGVAGDRLMTLGRLKGLLEKLLASGEGAAFWAAVDEKRDDAEFAEIARYGSAAQSLAGAAAAWAGYRKAREESGLAKAETDAKIAAAYRGLTAEAVRVSSEQAWEEIGKLKGEFEAKGNGKEPWYYTAPIAELSAYARALREAGAGLDPGGALVLEEYVQGLLEYAGIRDANNGKYIDLAGLEAAYGEAARRHEAASGWQVKLGDCAEFMGALDEMDRAAWLGAEARGSLARYGAGLMLRELSPAALRAVGSFDEFKQAVQGQAGAGWARGYAALGAALQEELYGHVMALFRPGDADDEAAVWLVWWYKEKQAAGDADAEAALREYAGQISPAAGGWYLAAAFMADYDEYNDLCELLENMEEEPEGPDEDAGLEGDGPGDPGEEAGKAKLEARKAELEAGFETGFYREFYGRAQADGKYAENCGAEWYIYYLAGPDLLYVFLSSPEGFRHIPEAAGYLGTERKGKLLSYYRVENLARQYIPLADGDSAEWVEKQVGLSDAEKRMLKEYLAYGDYHRGLEYYRWEEQEWAAGGGAAAGKRLMEGFSAIGRMLEELKDTGGLHQAEAGARYARHAEAERARQGDPYANDGWIAKLKGWYSHETEKDWDAFTGELKAAIRYLIDNEGREQRLERAEGKIGRAAGLFGPDGPWGGAYTEQAHEQAFNDLIRADAGYRGALQSAEALAGQMRQYLALYGNVRLDAQELKAREEELKGSLKKKQEAYDEYREGEYNKRVEGIKAAYALYEEAAGELNARHAALNAARLEVRKKQEVYDWAESVYLGEAGAKGTEGYETPKEKLGRAQYACERAQISVEVLEGLASGSPLEGREYGGAMQAYKEAAEKHYLGMVARYGWSRRSCGSGRRWKRRSRRSRRPGTP